MIEADVRNCPGCSTAMSPVTLTDRSGAAFDVDVCRGCRAFWFDRRENTRLSPAATLALFNLIAEQGPGSRPFDRALACPRCAGPLSAVHDMQQKGTRFDYWRCASHGHFITFLQFLKEKNFVGPLTPGQVADLRQNVRMLNCSNCGGAIDLLKQTVCPHCASPLSMIDMTQVAAQVQELMHQRDEAAAAAPPADGIRVTRVVTISSGGRSETVKSTITSTGKGPDADRAFAEAVKALGALGTPGTLGTTSGGGGASKSLVHAGLTLAIRRFGKQ